MTEVAGLLIPADHRLTNVRRYEAGPPEGLELVEPGETFATTKEEEWVSKKKTEVINTKQIETRVKRQVVLEDGKVVEDSGPQVTTNTTEDTETQEHHQTELRKLGDDDNNNDNSASKEALEGSNRDVVDAAPSKWVSVPNPDGVVREVKEKRVISREETEEIKETEDVQHFGDITDEDFLAAVNTGERDIRQVLHTSTSRGGLVLSSGPRLVRESSKTNKTIDTENKRELSSALPDGKIITETERTTEHEEIKDEELPEGGSAPLDFHKETSQRCLKTRDQEDVDYLADGVKIAHEMRFRTETMEVERNGGDGNDLFDERDFDSLSARARRARAYAQQRHPQRLRAGENAAPAAGASPLDRKDALTRKPLDFDQEEETRKVETSKWLEHHFGSESRSSNNSIIDEDDEEDSKQPPKTTFFNVTIKSQPRSEDIPPPKIYNNVSTNLTNSSRRVAYSPVEPERNYSEFYKGISQWSDRQKQDGYYQGRRQQQKSPTPDYVRDVAVHSSPVPDYPVRLSASPPLVTPTPPQRKRASERRHQQHQQYQLQQEERRYGRSKPLEEPPPDYSPPANHPPPPPIPVEGKKVVQKTRFAPDPPKAKSGNIIGQSIRKLVGKIRSASAERKAAKQRAKRSPSPSYQKGHIIDGNIGGNNMDHNRQPVQRYYLGEDPFAGSIYGRENKYDGVKPTRRHATRHEEPRSQSTLGRFSKSTSRLVNSSEQHQRSSQTLPRHLSAKHEAPTRLEKNNNKSNSTINVSIINTVNPTTALRQQPSGPAKPARTYKSNLSRSKSLNVHAAEDYRRPGMYTSNPHLNRLEENPAGLKSPGLISSLSRSQKDLIDEATEEKNTTSSYTSRFARNGFSDSVISNNNNIEGSSSNKRVFLKGLKDRAPELFKTLHENEHQDNQFKSVNNSTTTLIKSKNGYNNGGDIYEPPTRLRDSVLQTSSSGGVVVQHQQPQSILRRGSSSSTDYSETYHTTTRSDDPMRPSVTNTVKSFSKKTIPSRDGRSMETIESSETKSVTKSHFRGGSGSGSGDHPSSVKFYESEKSRYGGGSGGGGNSPVVIEVRNSNYRK